ncbi:MAG TPA: hypothetical protein DCL54_03905 [Alphaproteobacteria bacterium]|nr:hypothetical protein [Alphaproteobacteria bacterium]HAJ45709.1 hypothetical protein [Alphaproteobacteria bacterium]
MTPARLLTIPEAAEALGVCEDTFRAIVKEAGIPRIQISARVVRFDPADIAAFIERAKCQSTEKAASGTTTSSIRASGSTVRRARTQSAQLKPWSERSDLKPRPAPVRTQES